MSFFPLGPPFISFLFHKRGHQDVMKEEKKTGRSIAEAIKGKMSVRELELVDRSHKRKTSAINPAHLLDGHNPKI